MSDLFEPHILLVEDREADEVLTLRALRKHNIVSCDRY